jgi:hypothetical protein
VGLLAVLVAACGADDRAEPGTEEVAPCLPEQVPTSLEGYGPGDLLGAEELDVPPTIIRARAWRILYLTLGSDERSLVPVCGIVVTPRRAQDLVAEDGNAKMVAWAHGTLGLVQACQPSTDPAENIFGPMPGGIGAVAWGSFLNFDGMRGDARVGGLQTLVDQGRVVTATDYFVGLDDTDVLMRYVVGPSAGAAVVDSARAAAELVRQELGVDPPAYDTVVWGHSQGGHAALWAGQVATPYLAQTAPARNVAQADVRLAGVVGEAPATSFVAGPSDPPASWGTHLGDREMHQLMDVDLLDVTIAEVPIGIALFSYVGASWPQLSREPLAEGAEFPAYPPGAGDLDQTALLTGGGDPSGVDTAEEVARLCLTGGDEARVAEAVEPFKDPAEHAFFVEPVWGEPGPEGTFEGRLDETCNTTDDAGTLQWCRWLRWNQPGPAGDNIYSAVPRLDDGSLAPVLVVQGMNDTIIHCVSDGDDVPVPADCLSRQYYDEMAAVYCPDGGAEGSLGLRVWRQTSGSPATHFSIPGQAGDNGELGFSGSVVDRFLRSVLDDAVGPEPGCTAQVVN